MNKRLKYALMTTLPIAAVVFGMSGTANAEDSPWVYTTDPAPGGSAKFYSGGTEKISVCDLEADGLAAYVTVWDVDGPEWNAVMEAKAGGKGNCVADSYNIPEGHEVIFHVELTEPGHLGQWTGTA